MGKLSWTRLVEIRERIDGSVCWNAVEAVHHRANCDYSVLPRDEANPAHHAFFRIAMETGVVMVVYLHEALEHKLKSGDHLTYADVEVAAIEGAVQRLRPKLMTVSAVLASLVPILWESGIGSDVMKPIAAPIVGGMITSTIHVLILVPVFFVMMKQRALKRGTLLPRDGNSTPAQKNPATQSST